MNDSPIKPNDRRRAITERILAIPSLPLQEEAEKRVSEEATLRRAGDARLSVLKKQLEEMTAEHTAGVGKLQQQLDELR